MNNTDAIARRIDTCRPRCLSTEAWAPAQSEVRALARAAAPRTPDEEKGLASTLCTFLATPWGWLHEGAPDLKALLTDAAIERYAARFSGPVPTRQIYVGRLRSLQRALLGATREPSRV